MISGEKREVLKEFTDKSILAFISDYDIFRYYMPEKNWELNRACNSPFRKETNPSFSIYTKDGRVMFVDFSDSKYRGDCFQFVQFLYNIDYNKALEMIDKDFNLGIRKRRTIGDVDYKQIISKYEQPEVLEKKYSHVQVITRKFTNEELEYWNQYHQDVSDLKENNIYSIKKLYLNRKSMPLSSTELRFGYLYEDSWKIYRPLSKEFKWIPNNVPITSMDGKENIVGSDLAFINKSKKDYMVIKKLYPYTCAVQNEGIGCFSKENVEFLKSNSKRQVLSFDSDEPGVKNSKMVTNMFDFEYCNVPSYYLKEGIKDWADLARKYGMIVVEHYLKQKRIIK